jgi:hypothetical protein
MNKIIDPDKAKVVIDTKPYFSKETKPNSMRVGFVRSIELAYPDSNDKKRGETTVRVTLLVGDTGYHESLITRANQEDSSERNSSEKDSSIIDMPEGTGCTKASISITAEPGNDPRSNFSEVVVGAEMLKTDSAESDKDFQEQKEAIEKLMRAVGQAAAQVALGSLSDLLKGGIVFIVEPGKGEEPSGNFYPIITVDNPDSSAE